jgi:hypothetical protein
MNHILIVQFIYIYIANYYVYEPAIRLV